MDKVNCQTVQQCHRAQQTTVKCNTVQCKRVKCHTGPEDAMQESYHWSRAKRRTGLLCHTLLQSLDQALPPNIPLVTFIHHILVKILHKCSYLKLFLLLPMSSERLYKRPGFDLAKSGEASQFVCLQLIQHTLQRQGLVYINCGQ